MKLESVDIVAGNYDDVVVINGSKGEEVVGTEYVGGLAGWCEYGEFVNCQITGSIQGWGQYCGGLIGYLHRGDVSFCHVNAIVKGVASVGGLIGSHNGGNNDNSQVHSSSSQGQVTGEKSVGGLIGLNRLNAKIEACFSSALVTAKKSKFHDTAHYAGGLVGYNHVSNIYNSYVTGSIQGDNNYIGGLVGLDEYGFIYPVYRGFFTNCYSLAPVTGGPLYVNALLGHGMDNNLVIHCFWDKETSGIPECTITDPTRLGNCGTAKTTSEMMDILTYVNSGWDISEDGQAIWRYSPQTYPKLSWESGIHCPNVVGLTREAAFSALLTSGFRIGEITYGNSNEFLPGLILSQGTDPTEQVPAGAPIDLVISLGPPKYSGGAGLSWSPYRIATREDLIAMGQNVEDYDKYFVQVADIDMSPELPGGLTFQTALIAPDTVNDSNNDYQGVGFTGSFSGIDPATGFRYTISNLTIYANSGQDYLGLFGMCTGGTIEHIHLTDVVINTEGHCQIIGGLAGHCEATLINCSVSGSIAGSVDSHVAGGLAGIQTAGALSSCAASAAVTGGSFLGGLAGFQEAGIISNCYATGQINGTNSIGGLLGYQQNEEPEAVLVENCYAAGQVSGNTGTGGLLGAQYNPNNQSVVHCFWDVQTSGQAGSAGGTGVTGSMTDQMMTAAPYLGAGWDFTEEDGDPAIWQIWPLDYPRLIWENNPYLLPVNFKDKNLKAAVEAQLRRQNPTPLDMLLLTTLEASNREIVFLDGLEYAVNLAQLDIGSNAIDDLNPIKELQALTRLNAGDNQIADLSPLAGLSQVTWLNIAGNLIHNMSSLADLVHLNYLDISDNSIINLSPLNNMVRLEHLALQNNLISDLSPIAALTRLVYLDLGENLISNITPLVHLEIIHDLYLQGNYIREVNCLSYLTQLHNLQLSGNNIVDISAFSELIGIEILNLADNNIEEIASLSRQTCLTCLDLRDNPLNPCSYCTYVPTIQANNPDMTFLIDPNPYDCTQCRILRYYVDDDAQPGGDGLSWSSAFNTLQDALLYAANSDTLFTEIWVAEGAYRPDQGLLQTPGDRSATFEIPARVKLYGGFTGNEEQIDQRPSDPSGATRLSGDLGANDAEGIYDDNSYCVVTLAGSDLDTDLDRVLICGGHAENNTLENALSGGLFIAGGKPNLSNIVLNDNSGQCATHLYLNYTDISLSELVIQPSGYATDVSIGSSISRLWIDNLFLNRGSLNLFASDLFGSGTLQLTPDSRINILNAKPCSGRQITRMVGGRVDESWLALGNEWHVLSESLTNLVVQTSQDTQWVIAPSYSQLGPATLLWYDNRLIADQSQNGVADAIFSGGGILEIYGSLYDGLDENSSQRLFDGLLLRARVGLFEVQETSDNQLEIVSDVTMLPYDGFLVTNQHNIHLNGPQKIIFEMGYAQQHHKYSNNREVDNFSSPIWTDETCRLSIMPLNNIDKACVSNCTFTGPGSIHSDIFSYLVLTDSGSIHLTDGSARGDIVVDGTIIAGGNSQITGNRIYVNDKTVQGGETINYDDLGGSIHLEGQAAFIENEVYAQGDRYLDVEPYLLDDVVILNNQFHVIINRGQYSNQGMLLEARSRDADCGLEAFNNPECRSGIWQTTIGNRFDNEQANNWVLERLEIRQDAKVNITNRVDYQLESDQDEVVYVRELVLYPGAILNTALFKVYYETLFIAVSDPGTGGYSEIPVDAVEPGYPKVFDNGSQIVDIPLLGFSLIMINFNDPTPYPDNEFNLRIKTRLTDENDFDPEHPDKMMPEGRIERLEDYRGENDGVMIMETLQASSVAATAAFANAYEEELAVDFEYKFSADTAADTELRVYLNDSPEPGDNPLLIAVIKPVFDPAVPGGAGSEHYAKFYGVFPKGPLNFTRGTYVELELVGQGAEVTIDNWDPWIVCSYICIDYNGDNFTSIKDYFSLMAEVGVVDPLRTRKYCLDITGDGYVTSSDLTGWDDNLESGACQFDANSIQIDPNYGDLAPSSPALLSFGALKPNSQKNMSASKVIINGQNYDPRLSESFLPIYSDWEPAGNKVPPARVDPDAILASGGKLVADGSGEIYQIHDKYGIISQRTGEILMPWKSGLKCGFYQNISIGKDVPVSDIAFDWEDNRTLYLTPVLIQQGKNHSFKAAARLENTGTSSDPNYTITQIYGNDPSQESTTQTINTFYYYNYGTGEYHNVNRDVYMPNYYQVQEIEVDKNGHVFVLSTHGLNASDYILIYNEDTGHRYGGAIQQSLSSQVKAPIGLTWSPYDNQLYLASGARFTSTGTELSSNVYRFSFDIIEPNTVHVSLESTIPIEHDDPNNAKMKVAVTTALAVDPDNGDLYVAGFRMPDWSQKDSMYLSELLESNTVITPFTVPTIGIVPTGMTSGTAVALADPDRKEFMFPYSIVSFNRGCIPGIHYGDLPGTTCGVDTADLGLLLNFWLENSPATEGVNAVDLIGDDGFVDLFDYQVIARNWLHGL